LIEMPKLASSIRNYLEKNYLLTKMKAWAHLK
jgi:hypothetical protein